MFVAKKLNGLVVALAVAVPQMVFAAHPHELDARDDGPKTRAEVRQELREWERNPVSHDGWTMLGDGTVYVGQSADQQARSERHVNGERNVTRDGSRRSNPANR